MRTSKVKKAVAEKDFSGLRKQFKQARPADIAEAASSLSLQEASVVVRLIGRRASDVFAYFRPEFQLELLENLPDRTSVRLLNDMEPDDRTTLLQQLPQDQQARLLLTLSPEERRVARELLSYEEDSVGRLMTTEVLSIREDMTVAQALDWIRWQGAGVPTEYLSHLFVTDERGVYLGDIPLGSLVMCDPPSLEVSSIMTRDIKPLRTFQPETKAVDKFRKYDVAFLPVLDEQNVLVGMVTSDDVFDVAEEDATEDIHAFGGQAALEQSYFQTALFTLLRKRAGWLAVLFLGEMFTVLVLKNYDEAIANLRYIVYFMPLIISSGGNSGTQAASLIIRGLAVSEMTLSHWRRVLAREVVMGLGLGLLLGIMGVLSALLWGDGAAVAMVAFASLIGVVMFGVVIGSMLPFAFQALKLDPAVSSSPFIACLVDLFGVLIFVKVALYGAEHFPGWIEGVRSSLLPWLSP